MFRALGRMAIWLATAAFLVAVSLTLIGSYLLTWPILRKSPREQKVAATMNVATAALGLIQVFAKRAGVTEIEMGDNGTNPD